MKTLQISHRLCSAVASSAIRLLIRSALASGVFSLLATIPCLAQEYTITTIAGGGSRASGKGDGGPAVGAWINDPRALAVDEAGTVYVAESGFQDVRKVSQDGSISTIGGTDARRRSSFDGWINGIAVDGSGNIYVSDRSGVQRISPSGAVSRVIGGGNCWVHSPKSGAAPCRATDARLGEPFGVAVDPKGELYAVDRGRNNVLALQPDGTVVTVASMSGPNNEYGYSGDGGPVMEAKLRGPSAIAFDQQGNLYIADTFNNRVRKVNSEGIVTTIAGNGAYRSGGFINSVSSADGKPALQVGIQPVSIAVDNSGNVFIAAPEDGCIWIVSRDGRARIIAGGGSALGDGGPATNASLDPRGIALGKRGALYVADGRNGRIRLLTPKRPPVESVPVQDLREPNVSLEEIADGVSKSIKENALKYEYLLYNWELRAEFDGTRQSAFPRFSQPSAQDKVHTQMPIFRGHFEKIGSKPTSVPDGWEDLAPLKTSNLRNAPPAPQGEPETVALIQALLSPPQRATIVGVVSDGGSRAYVVESVPPAQLSPSLRGAARCASAIRATIFVDAQTFFPLRMDAEVVAEGMCSGTGNLPLDSVGTREQVHFAKVSRKPPCGDVREIWVPDEAIQRSQIHSEGYIAFPGQPWHRSWPLGPDYRGGEFKGTTIRKDFQVFVTSACLLNDEVVEAKPIESVHTEIHFLLDDANVPFQAAGSAPAHKQP